MTLMETLPARAKTPTVSTQDGNLRLWGFQSGVTCAFKEASWQTAAACAGSGNGLPDSKGRWWGCDNGKACDKNSNPASTSRQPVPSTVAQPTTAPAAPPATAPAAQPKSSSTALPTAVPAAPPTTATVAPPATVPAEPPSTVFCAAGHTVSRTTSCSTCCTANQPGWAANKLVFWTQLLHVSPQTAAVAQRTHKAKYGALRMGCLVISGASTQPVPRLGSHPLARLCSQPQRQLHHPPQHLGLLPVRQSVRQPVRQQLFLGMQLLHANPPTAVVATSTHKAKYGALRTGFLAHLKASRQHAALCSQSLIGILHQHSRTRCQTCPRMAMGTCGALRTTSPVLSSQSCSQHSHKQTVIGRSLLHSKARCQLGSQTAWAGYGVLRTARPVHTRRSGCSKADKAPPPAGNYRTRAACRRNSRPLRYSPSMQRWWCKDQGGCGGLKSSNSLK